MFVFFTCGTLLARACRISIESLMQSEPDGIYLKKYNEATNLLDPSNRLPDTVDGARHLVSLLEVWTNQLDIPTLGFYIDMFEKSCSSVCQIIQNE